VLEQAFPNNFLIFKPKNIVSGDFYWVGKLPDGRTLIAAADCTGHGVPGAFMSMLGITHLREIVSTWDGGSAGDLLNALRTHVIGSLNQNGTDNVSVDGMDMALVLINEAKTAVEFAGAYHSVFLCRDAAFSVDEASRTRAKSVLSSDMWNLLEFKGNKMPIGFHIMADKAFDTITFPLQKGDRLYLFSDGYADQFGGPTNAKFTLGSFRRLVLDIQSEPIPAQQQLLNQHFEQFMGEQKQVDDILVMGIEF
jgi:serine phosphatase RsbU (regulator of sigma subunit)